MMGDALSVFVSQSIYFLSKIILFDEMCTKKYKNLEKNSANYAGM